MEVIRLELWESVSVKQEGGVLSYRVPPSGTLRYVLRNQLPANTVPDIGQD